MAALAPTPAQLELISSLTQDEIPIKLRCATCSKLAINACRLPCCDQAICETCQNALSSACPVCEHTPVAAVDCKPNKSLRTTIRVFLRTEEKKREAMRVKAQNDTPPITPSGAYAPLVPTKDKIATPHMEHIEDPLPEIAGTEDDQTERVENGGPFEEQKDIPQPSIEQPMASQEVAVGDAQTHPETDTTLQDETPNEVDQNEKPETTRQDENGTAGENTAIQNPGFGTGFEYGGTISGMPNMGMMGGGDFNQMQMMMAMQNGMAPNAFGGFSMGFPGMPMDPMAMQSMFMNGGFGAGMNGMGMGMGMNGFQGDSGNGFNNGWNGQQSWNFAQDNFNHQNAAGMGQGDFGAHNSGFNQPNAAGHMQGNVGHQNHYNNGFNVRGRGRGGYSHGQGRGGFGHNTQGDYSQQYVQGYQNGHEAGGDQGEQNKEAVAGGVASNVDEFGREKREPSQKKTAEDEKSKVKGPGPGPGADDGADEVKQENGNGVFDTTQDMDDAPQPIQTVLEAQAVLPSGFSKIGFSPAAVAVDGWGQNQMGYGANNGFVPHNIASVMQAPDVPMNAPKGPKAMRDGLPNTSINFLRGHAGFNNVARPAMPTNGSYSEVSVVVPAPSERARSTTQEPKGEVEQEERDRSRTPRDDDSKDQSREDRRERRRERERERRRHDDASGDDKDDDGRRERRRHRSSRRHEDDREHRNVDDGEENGRDTTLRSRSHSASDSRRSGHRSRRDKDAPRERDRERDRDKDRDRDRERERDRDRGKDRDSEKEHKSSSSSHKHRSSHRSHRDRSRSRSNTRQSRTHRDGDRSREHRSSKRHEEKESSRDKERDREKHQSRDQTLEVVPETRSVAPTDSSKFELPINIPKGPRAMSHSKPIPTPLSNGAGIGIKGSANRHLIDSQKENAAAMAAAAAASSGNASRSNQQPSSEHRNGKDRDRSSRYSRDSRTRTVGEGSKSSEGGQKQTNQDPHTLEREARNRERLLKEAQRMAGLAGGKRSREEGEGAKGGGSGANSSTSGRKKRRSEVDVSGLEERIAKGERERDGARWE